MKGAFQAAIYARLAADPALAALGVAVHDFLPQSEDGIAAAGYPALAIGEIDEREFDTARDDGSDFLLRVHSYTAGASMLDLAAIQSAVKASLHRKQGEIAVAGGNLVLIRRDGSTGLDEPGGLHGICEYRALVEKIPAA